MILWSCLKCFEASYNKALFRAIEAICQHLPYGGCIQLHPTASNCACIQAPETQYQPAQSHATMPPLHVYCTYVAFHI